MATHRLVEVHVVGEDFDVGVEDVKVSNHLLQDVSDPSREDEQGDVVLVQLVEEELVAIPVQPSKRKVPASQTAPRKQNH